MVACIGGFALHITGETIDIDSDEAHVQAYLRPLRPRTGAAIR
jgi:hypothetical protein